MTGTVKMSNACLFPSVFPFSIRVIGLDYGLALVLFRLSNYNDLLYFASSA